jgi:hypothetical protein
MKNLLSKIIFSAAFVGHSAFAVDRAFETRDRITQALGSFLDRQDYLVVVKKSDFDLSLSSTSVSSGPSLKLPGLDMSVDAEGNLTSGTEASSNSYLGPIEVSVLLDNRVGPATINTVKNLVSDLVVAPNVLDSVKIDRASLRQQPLVQASQSPEIVVQNQMPDFAKFSSEMIKFIALALGAMGLLFILFIKMLGLGNRNENQSHDEPQSLNEQSASANEDPVTDLGVGSLEAKEVFLLKIVAGDIENVSGFLSMKERTEVFSRWPSWLVSYSGPKLRQVGTSNLDVEFAVAEIMASEAVIREQGFDEVWLKTFPLDALGSIPTSSSKSQLLLELFSRREEALSLLDASDIDFKRLSVLGGATSEATVLKEKLFKLGSQEALKLGSSNAETKTKSQLLNKLKSFRLVESALQEAKDSLEVQSLEAQLPTISFIRSLDSAEWKVLLMQAEPDAYAWLIEWAGIKDFSTHQELVRPFRWTMLADAIEQARHRAWSKTDEAQQVKPVYTACLELLKLRGEAAVHAETKSAA